VKRIVVLSIFILVTTGLFADEKINLFGIEGTVMIHISTATNAEWTLKCLSNNNERETVRKGSGEKYIPLEELLIEPLNPFETHEFLLSLSSTSSIPSFSLEISTNDCIYILQEGFISSDSPEHNLVLIYQCKRIEEYKENSE
jgi:hypothetical protein